MPDIICRIRTAKFDRGKNCIKYMLTPIAMDAPKLGEMSFHNNEDVYPSSFLLGYVFIKIHIKL